MARQFALLLVALFNAASAVAQDQDISEHKQHFERSSIERLQLVLDPLLGRQNYSISFNSTHRAPNNRGSELYFSKLGITSSIGPQTHQWIDFAKLVTGISVKIDISDRITAPAPERVKEIIQATLNSVGREIVQVDVERFTPLGDFRAAGFPWTSISIMTSALLMALGLYRSVNRVVSEINGRPAAATATSSPIKEAMTSSLPNLPLKKLDDSDHTREGIKRWQQWARSDTQSARAFLERLTWSEEREDQGVCAYVLQHSNLDDLKILMADFKKDGLDRLKAHSSIELTRDDLAVADHYLVQNVTTQFLTVELDSEHILQYIHDLTVEECVALAKEDPQNLSLFMAYFPTPHMEAILNWIEVHQLETYLAQPEISQAQFKTLALEAQKRVKNLRDEKNKSGRSVIKKWLSLASHLDAEREEVLFKSAARQATADEFLIIFQQSFPQFLMYELPDAVLKPVLNSIPFEDRCQYLAACPSDVRQKLASFYRTEDRMRELLEMELQLISSDSDRLALAENRYNELHHEFVARVRKYLQSSAENRQASEQILRKWVQKNFGADHGTKAA